MQQKEVEMKESEIVELKKSTSELKGAITSIASMLNKHQKGELYFGIKRRYEKICINTLDTSTIGVAHYK